jgi:hypothetical protein
VASDGSSASSEDAADSDDGASSHSSRCDSYRGDAEEEGEEPAFVLFEDAVDLADDVGTDIALPAPPTGGGQDTDDWEPPFTASHDPGGVSPALQPASP